MCLYESIFIVRGYCIYYQIMIWLEKYKGTQWGSMYEKDAYAQNCAVSLLFSCSE
jgi:hypothetical protein